VESGKLNKKVSLPFMVKKWYHTVQATLNIVIS
jgi:hypothetical protein